MFEGIELHLVDIAELYGIELVVELNVTDGLVGSGVVEWDLVGNLVELGELAGLAADGLVDPDMTDYWVE